MKQHKLLFYNNGMTWDCYVMYCPRSKEVIVCSRKVEIYEDNPNNIFEVRCPFCRKFNKTYDKTVRGNITGIFLRTRKKVLGV